MTNLTPMYLMPGTHVTVREIPTWPRPLDYTRPTDHFTTPGRPTAYRAIGLEVPNLLPWVAADIRKALGGRRHKKWESNPPSWPKPDPNPQPVTTASGTWLPVGQLVSRAEAKRRGGGLPINEHCPAIGPVAVMDWLTIQDQRVNPTSCHTSGEYNQNSYEAPGKDCI